MMFGSKGSAGPTTAEVLAALKGVKDPDLGRDLVDLGMIKDVRVDGRTVALSVNLTTPACPLKAKIEADVRDALVRNLGPDLDFRITMTAEVRGKGLAEKGDIAGVKNVIAVGSGKGGVGKSTMAATIAYGLARHGASVGMLDADVYGPSIPHLMGATGRPMARGERIQPIQHDGLLVMSMAFLLSPDDAVVMRGPMLHGVLQQFLHQVDWGPLDYLVIDLPPGTGDIPLSLAQSLPLTGSVVVCTPQEVALLDAVRAVSMFRKLKVPILGMVENMSYFDLRAYLMEHGSAEVKRLASEGGAFDSAPSERVHIFGQGGVRRKAEQLGVPFLGEVPLNVSLRASGDAGRIGDSFGPGSPVAGALDAVVTQLAAEISKQNLAAPKLPKLEILN
jgi:ATP-binding protein involved in chromosome partitioning